MSAHDILRATHAVHPVAVSPGCTGVNRSADIGLPYSSHDRGIASRARPAVPAVVDPDSQDRAVVITAGQSQPVRISRSGTSGGMLGGCSDGGSGTSSGGMSGGVSTGGSGTFSGGRSSGISDGGRGGSGSSEATWDMTDLLSIQRVLIEDLTSNDLRPGLVPAPKSVCRSGPAFDFPSRSVSWGRPLRCGWRRHRNHNGANRFFDGGTRQTEEVST